MWKLQHCSEKPQGSVELCPLASDRRWLSLYTLKLRLLLHFILHFALLFQGAREFIVPTHTPGKFYTLPQSPQQVRLNPFLLKLHRPDSACIMSNVLWAKEQPVLPLEILLLCCRIEISLNSQFITFHCQHDLFLMNVVVWWTGLCLFLAFLNHFPKTTWFLNILIWKMSWFCNMIVMDLCNPLNALTWMDQMASYFVTTLDGMQRPSSVQNIDATVVQLKAINDNQYYRILLFVT